jgi:caffeoyl-CoA O-methyltransferase
MQTQEAIEHPWNSELEVGEFIASLIKMTGARSVIEVGVFMGYTSAEIIDSMPKGSYFVGVDIEDLRVDENIACYEQANKRGVVTEFVLGSSLTELPKFKGNGFDIAFIDSAHHWQHILPEFKQVEPIVKPGGLLIYHDSLHIDDVARLMNYAKSYGYNKIDLNTPESRGLTILQRKP